MDIRPSKLDTETTLLQHPILRLVPPPPAPPPAAPAAPAAPAPDFRRSRQAGGPAGGEPTGPAAVSVPSRRPRPLRADLTRTAASRRYKQRPGGEEGNRRPGSYQRSSTADPPTPDPESPDRSPGSRTGPRSSCRAGNHCRSLLPAGGVRDPGKGGALPALQCAPRREAALELGAHPGGALRFNPRVFHGAGWVPTEAWGRHRAGGPSRRARPSLWSRASRGGSHPTAAGLPQAGGPRQDAGGCTGQSGHKRESLGVRIRIRILQTVHGGNRPQPENLSLGARNRI